MRFAYLDMQLFQNNLLEILYWLNCFGFFPPVINWPCLYGSISELSIYLYFGNTVFHKEIWVGCQLTSFIVFKNIFTILGLRFSILDSFCQFLQKCLMGFALEPQWVNLGKIDKHVEIIHMHDLPIYLGLLQLLWIAFCSFWCTNFVMFCSDIFLSS